MKRLSEVNWLEVITCINPLHGYRKSREADQLRIERDKYYREARTDSLSGYPNGIALREYLKDISQKASLGKTITSNTVPVVIYTVDLLGLHNFNEIYGYDAGNKAIISTLDAVDQVVSYLGGRTYREHTKGDEIIAIIENIDNIEADAIPNRIIDALNSKSLVPITYPIKDPSIKVAVAIRNSSIKVAIGMTYSHSGENLFEALDRSKEECSIEKSIIYAQHPEWERRMHKPIEIKSQT